MSNFEYMAAKDGLLISICVVCNKIMRISLMKIYLRDFKTTTYSVIEILSHVAEKCHSNLTMESITDADCKHAKRVWEDFRLPNLGQKLICMYKVSGKVKHELRVTSSNSRVTSSNSRVMSSNPRVASSNSRVRRLKARVARLKARVEAIKPRVK